MLDLSFSIADQNVATTKSIGIYNFSLHLLQHLANHPELRKVTVFSNRTIPLAFDNSDRVSVREYDQAISGKLGRIIWDQWGVYGRAAASRNPWLFLPKGFASFVRRPPVRMSAYVHDIMGAFYRRRYPDFWSRFEFQYFARSLRATIREAEVIFTNTEFTKSELMNYAKREGLAAPKVIVAGYGFERPPSIQTEKRNRVLLFASALPHKRTDIAIRFLSNWLRDSGYDGVIDCVGILSPESEKPQGPSWNWIGRVPPAETREMIRSSRAVVYTSEYEGFGMPPVEAVLEGTCPVFSDIPPVREVMGDAGCPFSNDSDTSFQQAMNKALAVPEKTVWGWADALLLRHNWPTVTAKIFDQLSVD